MTNQVEENKTSRGMSFTLSQLLIVCVCIGLFLSIYISRIVRVTIENNEGTAIGTLRTIAICMDQFRKGGQVDQDSDGSGEFGLFGELTGTTSRRGGGNPSNPSFITTALGPTGINNYSLKSGYRFQVHLPSPSKTKTITDNGVKGVPGLDCNCSLNIKYCVNCKTIDAQETHYRVYVWPDKLNFSGVRCFALDQRECVVVTSNHISYGGDNAPAFDAAVDEVEWSENHAGENKQLGNDCNTFVGHIGGKYIAKDGQKWIRTLE